jgi:hypothetical protein
MPVELTSIERKLLHLILDGGAAPGEISTGASKLISSLRNRGITAEELQHALNSRGIVLKHTRPDYGLIPCPFKKHKGEMARDIEPSYLRFMIGCVRNHEDPTFRQKFSGWADDMEQFLSQ